MVDNPNIQESLRHIPPNRADISVIPPEILSEIFVHCLPEDENSATQNTQQRLSNVCRLWRVVVLATPALWASLVIVCNSDILHSPPLPVIGAHLQRSGTHPFSFVIHVMDARYSPSASILAALTTARQRWRNVHIKLVGMTQSILDFITLGDAPLLQSLKCDVLIPGVKFPIPFSMVHDFPCLKSFEWDSFGSPLLPPLYNTLLTSLWLGTNLAVSECVDILRLCPRLCSAKFYNFYPSDSPPAPCLTHPTLHTFIATGEHSIALLAALTLPALLKLDLRPGHGMTPLPTEWEITLSAFLQRSNPTLRKLSSMSRMAEPALLRILALTPHLRILRLSDYYSEVPPPTAAFIRALHPPPLGVPLCPRLQILVLSRVADCPDGLCAAMLRARWGAQAHANGVACLEQAHIGFEGGGSHGRDGADMEELRAEGMQGRIYLRDPDEQRTPGR